MILFPCLESYCLVFCHTGAESNVETDSDSGKGTIASYDSTNSINSTGMSASTSGTPIGPTPPDNLEEFEVRKQQKDIWENGIEMWLINV